MLLSVKGKKVNRVFFYFYKLRFIHYNNLESKLMGRKKRVIIQDLLIIRWLKKEKCSEISKEKTGRKQKIKKDVEDVILKINKVRWRGSRDCLQLKLRGEVSVHGWFLIRLQLANVGPGTSCQETFPCNSSLCCKQRQIHKQPRFRKRVDKIRRGGSKKKKC